MKWIALLSAGAIGALSRHGIATWVQNLSSGRFPWGTLSVNLIGSLLFGILWTYFETRMNISPTLRLAVVTGFLGSFTTFSTFSFENTQLFTQGQWHLGMMNLVLQPAVGLLCFLLGQAMVQSLS